MGESKIFRLRGFGDHEERTSSAIVDATPVCGEAMVVIG